MYADLSHPTSTSLISRLVLLLWRLLHAFEPKDSHDLPAELGRLPDHLLRDIGVDPRHVRHTSPEAAAGRGLLQREWP